MIQACFGLIQKSGSFTIQRNSWLLWKGDLPFPAIVHLPTLFSQGFLAQFAQVHLGLQGHLQGSTVGHFHVHPKPCGKEERSQEASWDSAQESVSLPIANELGWETSFANTSSIQVCLLGILHWFVAMNLCSKCCPWIHLYSTCCTFNVLPSYLISFLQAQQQSQALACFWWHDSLILSRKRASECKNIARVSLDQAKAHLAQHYLCLCEPVCCKAVGAYF